MIRRRKEGRKAKKIKTEEEMKSWSNFNETGGRWKRREMRREKREV